MFESLLSLEIKRVEEPQDLAAEKEGESEPPAKLAELLSRA